MDNILTEWIPCNGCGLPVIERDGVLVDAVYFGPHGSNQIDTDVEHECNPR